MTVRAAVVRVFVVVVARLTAVGAGLGATSGAVVSTSLVVGTLSDVGAGAGETAGAGSVAGDAS